MKHLLLSIFLILFIPFSRSQACIDTIAYDNIETYDWFGGWWVGAPTTGYYTNASVSPSASAVIYGNGAGSSAYESDWYSLPPVNVSGFLEHKFSFRLGSYRFTSTGSTSGTDVGDYVTVQLSTDGGLSYTNEIRITGFGNAYWDYNSATVSKVSNGTMTTYSPSAGGNRTSTGDGYSIIELTIPAGPTQIAVDLFCRANATGEEWWLDNFMIEEIDPCVALPIELLSFRGEAVGGQTHLHWSTASEYNNDFFLVAKSQDGYNWSILGKVPGAGNSTQEMKYQLLDDAPYKGFTYYRLYQYDYDGTETAHQIIAIWVDSPLQTCDSPIYYDMLGKEIDIDLAPAGFYVRKCGNTTKMIRKV